MVEALRSREKVYLDTSLFIYYLEDNPKFADKVAALFEYLEENGKLICLSALALTEILVGPFKDGELHVVAKIIDYFKLSENIRVVDLSPEIAVDAAYLRGKYGFSTPDSIHLATAFQEKDGIFITNDKKLKSAEEVEVIYFEEL